jgi:hypothetical protein
MEKVGMKRMELQETIRYRGEDHLCVYYAMDLEGEHNG